MYAIRLPDGSLCGQEGNLLSPYPKGKFHCQQAETIYGAIHETSCFCLADGLRREHLTPVKRVGRVGLTQWEYAPEIPRNIKTTHKGAYERTLLQDCFNILLPPAVSFMRIVTKPMVIHEGEWVTLDDNHEDWLRVVKSFMYHDKLIIITPTS